MITCFVWGWVEAPFHKATHVMLKKNALPHGSRETICFQQSVVMVVESIDGEKRCTPSMVYTARLFNQRQG